MSGFDNIVKSCQYLLFNFPEANKAKEYLDQRLSPNIQEIFGFGYFPNDKYLNVLLTMVSEKELIDTKLIYENTYNDFCEDDQDEALDDDDYENSGVFNDHKIKLKNKIGSTIKTKYLALKDHNLILPYKNVYGDIVAVVGRTILDNYQEHHIPKYKNTNFKKANNLFGLFEAKETILKEDCVYIVEGQFDCIKAHDKWQSNVVALGSSNMSLYQVALLCRYTKNIFLLLDNDEAGRKGRELIHKKFNNLAKIKDIYVPGPFKDLDEYLSDNPERTALID